MSLAGDQPRISIVTPSLNQGRFLRQCIRSVLEQGYPNLEYIIVDGDSNDESLAVIGEYEKSLAWWVSEKDGGQSDAINKGFGRCTGEIVAWLNADDFYLPGALARVAEAYRQAPEASFYFGRCLRTDEAGDGKGEYIAAPRLIFNREAMIYGLNYIAQPATFIQREHLAASGYLNASLKYGMDSELWMRLSAVAAPVAIEAVLAASREYGQTKTSSGSFARIEELRKISEQYSQIGMTPGALCYFLDTFYKIVKEHPEVFPAQYLSEVTRFWASTSALFSQWGADATGTPISTEPTTPKKDIKQTMLKALGIW